MEILRERDLLPDYDPFELRLMEENTVDYLGVNYYQPLRVALLVMLRIQLLPYSLSNFMNPMSCQAARLIPTVVGEIYEQGLYDIAQKYQGKLWQYRVDLDRKWDGGRRRGKIPQGWRDPR